MIIRAKEIEISLRGGAGENRSGSGVLDYWIRNEPLRVKRCPERASETARWLAGEVLHGEMGNGMDGGIEGQAKAGGVGVR